MLICFNEDFIQKLAPLADISEELSDMNEPMKGPKINILAQNKKVNAFRKVLELCRRNTDNNVSYVFPTSEKWKNVIPAMKQKLTRNFLSATWMICRNSFHYIFQMMMYQNLNGFTANNISQLSTCKQEQLTDISCDGSLKDMFDVDKLPHIKMLVKNNYLSLSDKAKGALLLFVTTYLCKT